MFVCVSINTHLDAATGKNKKKIIMSNLYQNTDQNAESFWDQATGIKLLYDTPMLAFTWTDVYKKIWLWQGTSQPRWLCVKRCINLEQLRGLCAVNIRLDFFAEPSLSNWPEFTWRSNYLWFHTSTGASKVNCGPLVGKLICLTNISTNPTSREIISWVIWITVERYFLSSEEQGYSVTKGFLILNSTTLRPLDKRKNHRGSTYSKCFHILILTAAKGGSGQGCSVICISTKAH